MEPKSALFLSVKIIRIHCKKWGKGSRELIVKLPQNQGALFLAKKLILHNPPFRLRNPIFEVYGPIFSLFLRCFFGHFFGTRFF